MKGEPGSRKGFSFKLIHVDTRLTKEFRQKSLRRRDFDERYVD